MQSRRSALIKIATAAAVTPLLPGEEQHEHEMHDEAAPPHSQEPAYFNAEEYKTVSRIADLIIPKTDTPGAVEAGVPYRIDRQVGATPKLQEVFKRGLSQLDPQFITLSEAQQTAILKATSEAGNTASGEFFQTMKELTIEWYYRSEQGLVEELGFKGNTFRASFPGCTHPEHWPKQENA